MTPAITLETDSCSTADAVLAALRLCAQVDGQPATSRDALRVLTIIRWESDGDPRAVNMVDSNAEAGHPSQGLMQCVPSTFAEWALPGHDTDICDPLSNAIACIRYARARYGSLARVPGILKLEAASQDVYCGY